MLLKIHNFKLAALALLLIIILLALGFWQLSRAREKKALLTLYEKRLTVSPLSFNSLRMLEQQIQYQDARQQKDFRFYRTHLTGHFIQPSLLLDNKIFKGKVGYEVYTLFLADGVEKPIVIDRGFIPIRGDRKLLPKIDAIVGRVTITGMFTTPPRYFALGKMLDYADKRHADGNHHIYRIEYVNLSELQALLNTSLFPYIVSLAPGEKAQVGQTEWQIVTIPPEKHQAYALQWFALGLTLLILFLVLNHKAGKMA